MESESKNQVPSKSHENDFLLRWGNRKRSRWVKTKEKEPSLSPCNRQNKNFESVATTMTSNGSNDTKSPEPEERYYLTRGCVIDDNRKGLSDYPEEKVFVWPRFFISLSNKEKEDDFMVLKGCKLPQRPRKRAKIIQRTLLLLSPGAWLSDLCQERYEVREKKKSSKKRPRGLKAMNSMESDSD